MRVHCKSVETLSITISNGHSLLKLCEDTEATIAVVVLTRPHECSSP